MISKQQNETESLLIRISDVITLSRSFGKYQLFSIEEERKFIRQRRLAEARKQELWRLHALKRRKFIAIRRIEKEYYVAFTKLGLKAALIDQMIYTTKEMPRGTACYVVFDIPEQARKTRNHFRAHLKHIGFTNIQKSVWVTTKDVGKSMTQLIRELGVSKWVVVMNGQKF